MSKKTRNIGAYIALSVLSVIWLLPIVWVILTSFRGTPGVASPTFIPRKFTLNNYKTLFFRKETKPITSCSENGL